MYKPFDVRDALETIEDVLESPKVHRNIVDISDLGRQMEGYIIANDYENELCVWHEKELCESLLKQELEAIETDQIKGEYVSVGSLEEVTTGGNWPPSYDRKIADKE